MWLPVARSGSTVACWKNVVLQPKIMIHFLGSKKKRHVDCLHWRSPSCVRPLCFRVRQTRDRYLTSVLGTQANTSTNNEATHSYSTGSTENSIATEELMPRPKQHHKISQRIDGPCIFTMCLRSEDETKVGSYNSNGVDTMLKPSQQHSTARKPTQPTHLPTAYANSTAHGRQKQDCTKTAKRPTTALQIQPSHVLPPSCHTKESLIR